jgi:RNA polymerase sigma factor (sigma-70 family)
MTNISLLYGHFTDNELIDEIRNGHKHCFEILVRRYNQPLYRIGRMYGIAEADLADIICDAHKAAFKAIHTSRVTRSAYRVWLTEVMIQKCRTKQRNERQRSTERVLEDPSGMALRSAGHYNSCRLAGSNGMTNVLESNIDRLPTSLRTIFVLHEIEGYNASETARLLHLSESNIKTNINNAKGLLRKTIKNWHYYTGVYACSMDYNEYIVGKLMPGIISGYKTQPVTMPR